MLPIRSLIVALVVGGSRLLATETERPTGKFLFRPMLIWATSEVTHQGTGFLISHAGQHYGVTSIHFMDFTAGGLFEAIWLDIPTSKTVVGFRDSVGRPGRTSIDRYVDIAHDFVIMPSPLPRASSRQDTGSRSAA